MPSTRKAKPKTRKRRNPPRRPNGSGEEAAARLSEQFHGRPAHAIRDLEGERIERRVLAELGRLIELRVHLAEYTALKPRGVRLACNPEGTQLYFEGGDQALDLKALGIAGDQANKDHVDLGVCDYIAYETRKGFHDFARVDYWHKLGEVSKIRPTLHYDTLNELLYLSGGNYHVKPEGIVD
jgi:hypothetical protein